MAAEACQALQRLIEFVWHKSGRKPAKTEAVGNDVGIIDIALAVDALQTGLDRKIDIAVLVSGDGDFVPLVRVLNKQGIRVVAAYFDFTDKAGKKSFINERFLNCCNYAVDISALDEDRQFKSAFKSLFRTADEWKNRESLPDMGDGDEKPQA